jgi:hypothetical protein
VSRESDVSARTHRARTGPAPPPMCTAAARSMKLMGVSGLHVQHLGLLLPERRENDGDRGRRGGERVNARALARL